MTPIEQDHITAAYTFELSKCYEQTIRERQLQALANIDAALCKKVADGLGLTPPAATFTHDGEVTTSAALSQIGGAWPVAGRQLGIVIGDDVDETAVNTLQESAHAAGVVPLLVGPHGGKIGSLTVNRTYANAASIEFDALVLVGDLPPAPDAMVSGDPKAGAGNSPTVNDPRVIKLIGEAWRHSKAIGAIAPDESAVLTDAGITGEDEGVVVGTAKQVGTRILELIGDHRAWGRFATSIEV